MCKYNGVKCRYSRHVKYGATTVNLTILFVEVHYSSKLYIILVRLRGITNELCTHLNN